MDALVFRSRIDLLLAAAVIGPVCLATGLVVRRSLASGQAPGGVALAVLGLSVGLVAWIFASTSYRFTDDALLVQSGPMRVKVPLTTIRRVTRTSSILSAPALSLRRLEITYGSGRVIVISPNDEAGFLAALQLRVPAADVPVGR